MANKIKDCLENFIKTKDKKQIIIVIGIVGVLLILLSEFLPVQTASSSKSKQTAQSDYSQYVDELEKKTTDFISSIDGVGKCKVMITLDVSDENVYAKNIEESKDDGSYSKRSEYVLYEDNNNDTPILVKQYFPKVKGVAVTCTGGDNVVVREQIISGVSSLFGISSTKISVSKING